MIFFFVFIMLFFVGFLNFISSTLHCMMIHKYTFFFSWLFLIVEFCFGCVFFILPRVTIMQHSSENNSSLDRLILNICVIVQIIPYCSNIIPGTPLHTSWICELNFFSKIYMTWDKFCPALRHSF